MFQRWRHKALVGGAAALTALATGLIATTTPASAASGCRVAYTVASEWPGGFVANVDITNLGDPLSGWSLKWTFGGGQSITGGWNASYSQSGSSVTATNVSYNGSLGTNATVSIGFQGTTGGSNPAPSSFTLNGTACTGQTGGGQSSPSPTPTPTGGGDNGGGGDGSGAWPSATGRVHITSTQHVSNFDGGMKSYYGIGDGSQSESQDPMFEVASGGTIQNVIIDAPAGDGIHCLGPCTIRNVWWNDVGEDAATFLGSSSSNTYLVDGGGAKSASDKVFQHNGAGTVTIRNFQVYSAGKLYRACGNCSQHYTRHVVMNGVTSHDTGALAGINTNWGDTARFSRITVYGGGTDICVKYRGVEKGSEPTKIGTGADGVNCIYSSSDITYR
jgi:hypothetical protein